MYSKVYKKINGSWVEQSDIASVFSTSANYVKANQRGEQTVPNKVLKTINYNGEDYDINAANADIASVAVMANGLAGDIVIDGIAANSGDSVIHYAICSTAGNAANKTISLDNFQLVNGARVTVKFANSSTATNPTLKVGTTAAKPIWYNGNAVDDKTILAGQVYEFVYDSSDQR